MNRLSNQQPNLVAVVVQDDQVLLSRPHDTAVWRLPTTLWPNRSNPVSVVRELVAAISGHTVSPRLQASLNPADQPALLVFTAAPLFPAALRATRTARWVPMHQARSALQAIDVQILLGVQRSTSRGGRAARRLSSVPIPAHH